jgi:hypothetical protein
MRRSEVACLGGTDAQATGKDRSDPQKRPWEGLLLLWQPELSIGPSEYEAVTGWQAVRPLQSVPPPPGD